MSPVAQLVNTPCCLTRHLDCATDVRRQFLASLEELRASAYMGEALSGLSSGMPVFGVGHSNVALLHALMG